MAQEVGVKSIPNLQQFGHDLKILSEQLQTAFHLTERKMQAVCEGWTDQINMKFMSEFQKDTQEIDKIATRMTDFARFIERSCAILEMYQHNRM